MKIIISLYREYILVAVISILYASFLLSHVFWTIPNTPKGAVNMMVGHYYEDYYEYLSFVKQGEKPGLTLDNLFTDDDKGTLFMPWWPYRAIGMTGHTLAPKVNTVYYYWVASFFLLIILLLLTYKMINTIMTGYAFWEKLLAFFLAATSSGFYRLETDGGIKVLPYDFWYSGGHPFARFNTGTPHHELGNILFLLGIILAVKTAKKAGLRHCLLFALFSLLLFTTIPTLLMIYWLSLLITEIFYFIRENLKNIRINKDNMQDIRYHNSGPAAQVSQRSDTSPVGSPPSRHPLYFLMSNYRNILNNFFDSHMKYTALIMLFLLPVFFLVNKYFSTSFIYEIGKEWDRQNMYYPDILTLIRAYGPLFLSGSVGVIFLATKLSYDRLLYILIYTISLILILVPINIGGKNILDIPGIHNMRFQSLFLWIFMGAGTVIFLRKVFPKKAVFCLSMLAVSILYLPSLYSFRQGMMGSPYSASYLQYMPMGMYEGLESLGDTGTVLTSPKSALGLVAPAIAGQRVYIGRSMFTFDFERKIKEADLFYSLGMSEKEAREFLKKENIGRIVISNRDRPVSEYLEKYPFLKILSENGEIRVLGW